MLLAPFAVVFGLLGASGVLGANQNADLIQAFMEVADLLRSPASWLDWGWPPALFAFPDWLLVAVTLVPGIPNAWKLPLFSTLLVALLILSSAPVGLAISRGRWLRFTAVFAALLLSAYWFGMGGGERSSWFLTTMTLPSIHTGTAAVALASLGLFASGESRGGRAWMLAILCFLTVFSDALFIVWFVIPATLHAALTQPGFDIRQLWSRLRVILIPGAVAEVLSLLRHHGGVLFSVSPIKAVQVFVADVIDRFGELPFALMITLSLALLIRGALLLWRVRSGSRLQQGESVELLLALTMLMVTLVPLATGAFSEPALWRYMILMPSLDIAWASLLLVRIPSRLPSLAALAALLIVTTTGASIALADKGERLAAADDLSTCLLRLGQTDGYTDYWNAKRLIFLSEGKIHAAQLRTKAEPLYWIFNRQWFRTRQDGALFRPTFVVTTRLSQDALRQRFGSPVRREHCGDDEVWMYSQLPLVVSDSAS